MNEILKKMRLEAGLTQFQLAAISGISLPTVNRAESKNVKLSTYKKLMEAIHNYKRFGSDLK